MSNLIIYIKHKDVAIKDHLGITILSYDNEEMIENVRNICIKEINSHGVSSNRDFSWLLEMEAVYMSHGNVINTKSLRETVEQNLTNIVLHRIQGVFEYDSPVKKMCKDIEKHKPISRYYCSVKVNGNNVEIPEGTSLISTVQSFFSEVTIYSQSFNTKDDLVIFKMKTPGVMKICTIDECVEQIYDLIRSDVLKSIISRRIQSLR